MSDEDLPLVTVVGATSKQGRSVVRSPLRSGRFRARALTRDAKSAVARSLAMEGADLRELGDHSALVTAFRGSDAAFFMTPPIAPPATHELPFGKALADAALAAGVERFVFSSLEDVEKITGGKKFAPDFTDKARVDLPVLGDVLSPIELVATFERVTGRKAAYRSAYTRDELLHHFPAFGESELLVRELLGIAEYAVEYGYFLPDHDLAWSRRIAIEPRPVTGCSVARGASGGGAVASAGALALAFAHGEPTPRRSSVNVEDTPLRLPVAARVQLTCSSSWPGSPPGKRNEAIDATVPRGPASRAVEP